jgi:hypothetical protein
MMVVLMWVFQIDVVFATKLCMIVLMNGGMLVVALDKLIMACIEGVRLMVIMNSTCINMRALGCVKMSTNHSKPHYDVS